MSGASPCLLAINGGSSSIRFAVYEAGAAPQRRLSGTIDRVGEGSASLTVDDQTGKGPRLRGLAAADHLQPAEVLLDWLEAQPVFASVQAAGHRVVHGMKHSEPERDHKEAARGTAPHHRRERGGRS